MAYHSTPPAVNTSDRHSTLTEEETSGFTLTENSMVTVRRPLSALIILWDKVVLVSQTATSWMFWGSEMYPWPHKSELYHGVDCT